MWPIDDHHDRPFPRRRGPRSRRRGVFSGPAIQIFRPSPPPRAPACSILAYWCLLEGKARGLLAVVVLIEIAFDHRILASFRETVLTLLVAAAAARPRLDRRGLLGMAAIVALILVLGVFWSAIKPDYRAFLNREAATDGGSTHGGATELCRSGGRRVQHE